VTTRQREIGIRIAIGAAATDIVKAITTRMFLAIATGLAFGAFAAIGLLRLTSHLLFGIQALNPVAFLIAVGLILGCASGAAIAPVFRAVTTDPLSALHID
jgi:ABC-type antimicrobial peptide transport system permease subunit